jgi:hypothetical protein
MSVHIAAGVFDLKLPRIGWHAQGGTVSASSAAAGFAAARAVTQQTADGWKPSAMPASWVLDAGAGVGLSYCGIAAHDLATVGATVFVEYLNDATWITIYEVTPQDDGALFFLFPAIFAQQWRVRVTGDNAPTIGHIRFGRVLTVPRMATYTGRPIDEGERVALRYQISETGEYLGTVVEGNGLQFSVEIDHLSEAFRLGPWREFKRWAERGNTFFIAPKPYNYPKEVAYAWTSRAAVERTIANRNISGSVTLDCVGYAKP